MQGILAQRTKKYLCQGKIFVCVCIYIYVNVCVGVLVAI